MFTLPSPERSWSAGHDEAAGGEDWAGEEVCPDDEDGPDEEVWAGAVGSTGVNFRSSSSGMRARKQGLAIL